MPDTVLELAAITDEFSPDIEIAASAMAEIGMNACELRMIGHMNIMKLSDDEVRKVMDVLNAKRIRVLGISSPILKCTLPEGGEVDQRFQQDSFGSTDTMDDQPRLTDRAIRLCELTGARIVRVFSCWRMANPTSQAMDQVYRRILDVAQKFKQHDIVCGNENEHACNIGTAAEAAQFLNEVQHSHLKLVWDPANGLVAGEEPFPIGYHLLPKNRIIHVHAKDCRVHNHKPTWCPLGTGQVNWKGILHELTMSGYKGAVSLETHWPGPNGNKLLASTICGWNLRGLLEK